MSISFGSKKSKSSFERSPYFTDTGQSTINGRSIRLDPSIRGIQDKALQDYAGSFGDFGNAADRFLTQSGDLRGRYLGNQGALVQSRLRPLRERFKTLRDTTQQDLGRRGIGGSSFAHQALGGIDERLALAEGDVTAQAMNEALQFESGLNAQELDALNNAAKQKAAVTGESVEISKLRLLQELGIFGLGEKGTGSSRGKEFGIKGSVPIAPPGFSLFG